MKRSAVTLATILFCAAAPLAAQTAASVRIGGTTEAEITEALNAILAPQGFELKEGKHRAVFTQDRGNVPQRTGGVMHIRRELSFLYDTRGDTVRVGTDDWIRGSGTNGGSFDASRRTDPQKSRPVLQRILDTVKARLEQPPAQAPVRADSAGTD